MWMRRSLYTMLAACVCAAGCTNARSDAAAFRTRGDSLKATGALDLALAQYDRAIALDSTDGRVFNNRGATYMEQADYVRAVRDFDRAIALNPGHAQALKNRGRTLFFLGRFGEAAADLQRALPLDSTNAYVAIWLYIARRRSGENDAAAFAAQLARTDSTRWPHPVGQYYLGKLSQDQLLAAGAAIDPRVHRDQRCAAAFYLGEAAMIDGRHPEAVTRFTEARATCPHDWTEYQASVAELGRLGT